MDNYRIKVEEEKNKIDSIFLTAVLNLEVKYAIKIKIDTETRNIDFIGDKERCMRCAEELGSIFPKELNYG